MPEQTQEAVQWALQQKSIVVEQEIQVTKDTPHELVEKAREYFNANNIVYSTFSYGDLVPFLN